MSKKIAIIDDDPDIITFFKSVLEDEGYVFVEASDGEEGIPLIRSEKPDLVPLDLMMPKKGGFLVFNEMNDNPELQGIPIIIISGATQATGIDHKQLANVYTSEKIQDREEEADGAPVTRATIEYLEKPVEPDVLLTAVKKVLGE